MVLNAALQPAAKWCRAELLLERVHVGGLHVVAHAELLGGPRGLQVDRALMSAEVSPSDELLNNISIQMLLKSSDETLRQTVLRIERRVHLLNVADDLH